MSKGSKRRPTDEAAYRRNYEAIMWPSKFERKVLRLCAAGLVAKWRKEARIVRRADPEK